MRHFRTSVRTNFVHHRTPSYIKGQPKKALNILYLRSDWRWRFGSGGRTTLGIGVPHTGSLV